VTDGVEPNYNPIFERFVDPERPEAEQLTGIVAYGLYKIAKREWASELHNREERRPNEEELAAYIRTWTESRIKGTLEQAEGIMGTFSAVVVESASPEIREDALRGSFWEGVWRNIAANALYTLGLIAIVVILKWAGVDLLSLFKSS
jgi:hypothetical protein